MRLYVGVTGFLFFLLAVMHGWRVMIERQLAHDPFFIGISFLCLALFAWAMRLLVRTQE